MKFILTLENFKSNDKESIKNDIISKSIDIAKKYGGFDISTEETIKKPNSYLSDIYIEDFKIMLDINFTLISDDTSMNDQLLNEVIKSQDGNNYVNRIYCDFRQGGVKTKTEKGYFNKYRFRIELKNITIDSKIFDDEIRENKKRQYSSLVKSNVINFIDKYSIKSYDEFINVITISTRDLNKYAKSKDIDKNLKKYYYQIKDWVIKILFDEDYIESIKRHKIEGGNFGLIYTKVKHEDSLNGMISFHITPSKLSKFNMDIYDYPEEKRDYVRRETDIDNKERMLDFSKVINSNFVSPQFRKYLKKYFRGELK